jgi:hypothetical protein
MKRVRRDRERWKPPTPLLPIAVFECRRCHAALTGPLGMLADAKPLSQKKGTSMVPPGHYWPVPEGGEFAGQFAVSLTDQVGIGYHADTRRLMGCCGPNGLQGRNRVCGCGYEVGTERSDCIWPYAVYLDPSRVLSVAPDAEPGAAAAGGA